MRSVYLLLCSVLLLFGAYTELQGQIYHHRIGGGFTFATEEDGANFPALFYGARFNLTEPSDESAISINADLGLDFTIYGGSSGSGVLLNVDVPVYLSYDLWGYSTWNSNRYFGTFVGAGMEYFSFPVTFSGPQSSVAPMVIAGVRFAISDRNYGISASYRLGGSDQPNFVGLRASWLLGEY